jgi:hypothetical protein
MQFDIATTTELYAVFEFEPRDGERYDPGNNTAEAALYLILHGNNSESSNDEELVEEPTPPDDWEAWANLVAGVCLLTSPRAGEGADCPVCLDSMETKDVFVNPCCRRSFHFECLLRCGSRCPLCREPQGWWITP